MSIRCSFGASAPQPLYRGKNGIGENVMANVIAVGTVNPVELRLHKVLAQLPEDSSLESIYKACLDHDVDTVYFNRRTLFVAGLNSNAEPLVLPGVSGFMAGKRHIRVFFPDRKKRYKLHGLLSDGVEAAPKKQEHISYSFFEDGPRGYYRPGELRDDDYE